MRIRMIGRNQAVMDEYPKVTIEFADAANKDIADKVINLLIQHAENTDDMEESDETCCVSVPRFHGRTG